MKLTKEQVKQLKEASGPLIKFLSENFNPHVIVVVDSSSCELLEGVAVHNTDDFLNWD